MYMTETDKEQTVLGTHGNTLDNIKSKGTIYYDEGLKDIRNGKRRFKEC